MAKSNLDDLINNLAGQKTPELPSTFPSDVLRAIRLRASPSEDKPRWAFDLAWLQPRTMALAVTLAIAIGAGAPFAFKTDATKLAISGLDLDVFSSDAAISPSGLLAKIP